MTHPFLERDKRIQEMRLIFEDRIDAGHGNENNNNIIFTLGILIS